MKIFKIPYIKVNDVDEYFALPKSEREYYGLYKLPYALPCDYFDEKVKGWGAFREEIKKHYPIQNFCRYWLWSFDNPVYKFYSSWIRWPFRDFYFGAKRFFKPFYPRWRKTLPRYKYSDPSHLLVESNFNLLLDFWEEEVTRGIVDWNSDAAHKKFYRELKAHVKWIKEGRQKLQERADQELVIASKNKKQKDYHKKYGRYNKLEQQMIDKETEILKWMVDNRQGLWT